MAAMAAMATVTTAVTATTATAITTVITTAVITVTTMVAAITGTASRGSNIGTTVIPAAMTSHRPVREGNAPSSSWATSATPHDKIQ